MSSIIQPRTPFSAMAGEPRNIVRSLANREYWDRSGNRTNLRILRDLVLSDNVYYKRVFDQKSTRPILYEGDRIFMDNHRKCLTINGKHLQPAPLFALPPCPSQKKIEDVLICEATLSKIPLKNKGWRHCMICVTADNRLLRYDLDTGEELENVFLHDKYQFRYLSMEDEAETIIVRSQHATQQSRNVYKAVCMFTIFPLEFLCMFEVERDIFGKDIVDCMLYQGLMINKFAKGTLKFYDFNKIREDCTLFETKLSNISAKLPINLKITETPEVLFEIKCYNHDLHIGGSPWQYIQAHGPTDFSVHLMDWNCHLLPGVRLGQEHSTIDSDRAMFHPDDSGRIIYLTNKEVTVSKVIQKSHGPVLKNIFTISAQDLQLTKDISVTTSSGRRSRKIKRENVVSDEREITLDGLDYEDELELATACHVTPDGDNFRGRLCFYHNQNGKLLKEMTLDEEWDEFGDHLVVLDRDIINHIVKSVNNKYEINMYRLTRKNLESENETEDGDKKPKRKTKTKPKKKPRRKTPGSRRSFDDDYDEDEDC